MYVGQGETVFQHRRKGRVVGEPLTQNGDWLAVRLTEDHPGLARKKGEWVRLRTTLIESAEKKEDA